MPPEVNMNDLYQTLAITSNNPERYEIRPMLKSDIYTVTEIDQMTWNDESWRWKWFLRAHDDPDWNCWILESITDNHAIAGYGLQYTLDDASQHIANLTLHPDECGRGLGGILLRHMIGHARQTGAVEITLEVRTTNIRAYTLYVNHGFRTTKVLRQYYSDDSDAYYMMLLL